MWSFRVPTCWHHLFKMLEILADDDESTQHGCDTDGSPLSTSLNTYLRILAHPLTEDEPVTAVSKLTKPSWVILHWKVLEAPNMYPYSSTYARTVLECQAAWR